MKKKRIAFIAICFGYLYIPYAFSQQFALPAFTGSSYTNSLRDQPSIDTNFIGDYSYQRDDYNAPLKPFQNATFSANQSTGLELISQTPFTAQGSQVFYQGLPASKSWQIDVKAHISNFSSQLPEPYYYAGLTFGKLSSTLESSQANRVNLNFTRSRETSASVPNNNFVNTINSGIYSNDDPGTPPFVLIPNEDLYLKVTYDSTTMSCTHYYSFNGVNYTSFKSYYLKCVWELSPTDSFWVAVVGTSVPFKSQAEAALYPNINYNVASGQLYLSDFQITVSNNSSDSSVNTNSSSTKSSYVYSTNNTDSKFKKSKQAKNKANKKRNGSASSLKKSSIVSKKSSSKSSKEIRIGQKKKKGLS
jgi:hypothetical protein